MGRITNEGSEVCQEKATKAVQKVHDDLDQIEVEFVCRVTSSTAENKIPQELIINQD